jgi:hypothetical protein
METPVRLAERYDRMIFHEETPFGHTYRFHDDGVTYLHRPGEPPRLELLRSAG